MIVRELEMSRNGGGFWILSDFREFLAELL